MSKKVNKLTEPNMRLYFLLAAVFCAVTLWIEPILGLVEAGVMALTYVYFRRTAQKRREGIQRYVEDMTDDVASAGKSSMLSAPFAMMVFRPDTQEVLWSNESFLQLTGMRENLFDNRLEDTLPGFPAQWLLEGKSECPETVVVNNRHFRVFGSLTHPSGRSGARGLLALTYWMDVTEQDELRKKSEENRPIVAVLMLDNYEELMKAGTEAARSSVLAQIDEKISAWVSGTQGLLCKYDRNRYLLLLTEKHYNTLLEGKFSVLDAVRSVVTEDGVAATLSIGVGKDADDYETLFKNAGLSIEMALSRGGDQAVVKNRVTFEFFGGRGGEVERRTKVKSRVMANALSQLIQDSSKVYVMGHKFSDLDTLGAAAGVCCIARKLGTPCRIVMDANKTAAGQLRDRMLHVPEYAKAFLTPQEAYLHADSRTLLVVVDTNRPDQVENHNLLEACTRVAVIDHHRRAATYITNATMSFHEPYASSACELMTELLEELVEQPDILRVEAEAMLSGIMLDTKDFTVRTGERTFEAAAFLRRAGADTSEVKKLLQTDMEHTVARYKILQTASIYRADIAIAAPTEPQDRIVAAQAADELLNIAGVTASMVIYPMGDGDVFISARSIGELNVQLVMEALGGGGSRSSAAVQLHDVSVAQAVQMARKAIDDNLEN